MEALILAAALLTVDAEVRQSEAFALVGLIGHFPSAEVMGRQDVIAYEHLKWLTEMFDMGPVASDVSWRHIKDQKDVRRVYGELAAARRQIAECLMLPNAVYVEDDEIFDGPTWFLRSAREAIDKLRELIGDDDYFAGRLPAPVTSMRTRESE